MLSLPIGDILLRSQCSPSDPPTYPGQPKKFVDAFHLISAIHRHRVVVRGVGERIVPRWIGIVAIGSGVACDVLPPPPEINVQHVSLPWAVVKSAAPDKG